MNSKNLILFGLPTVIALLYTFLIKVLVRSPTLLFLIVGFIIAYIFLVVPTHFLIKIYSPDSKFKMMKGYVVNNIAVSIMGGIYLLYFIIMLSQRNGLEGLLEVIFFIISICVYFLMLSLTHLIVYLVYKKK